MWCSLLCGLLASTTRAFVLSPMQWAGLPARSFSIVPAGLVAQKLGQASWFPQKNLNVPHKLKIWDQNSRTPASDFSRFTSQPDRTITLPSLGLCIEANDAEGESVRLNKCIGGPAQSWVFLPREHGRSYQVQLEGTQRCIAPVAGGKSEMNGSPIKLLDCDPVTALWRFEGQTPQSQLSESSQDRTIPHRSGLVKDQRRALLCLLSLSMVGLSALSISAWMSLKRVKAHALVANGGSTPLSSEHAGVCLAVPLVVGQGSSTQQRNIATVSQTINGDMDFENHIPAVVTLNPVPDENGSKNDDESDENTSGRFAHTQTPKVFKEFFDGVEPCHSATNPTCAHSQPRQNVTLPLVSCSLRPRPICISDQSFSENQLAPLPLALPLQTASLHNLYRGDFVGPLRDSMCIAFTGIASTLFRERTKLVAEQLVATQARSPLLRPNLINLRNSLAAASASLPFLGVSMANAAESGEDGASGIKSQIQKFLDGASAVEPEKARVVYDGEKVVFLDTDGTVHKFALPTQSVEFLDLLQKRNAEYAVSKRDGGLFDTLQPFIILVALLAASRGAFGADVGKSLSKIQKSPKTNVTFDDVAGAKDAKLELIEVVEFLKDSSKYSALGAKIPKGVLMEGPPGTGKTLLARAVAGEAGVPLIAASGSEFIELFLGVGASRVRDIFKTAKKSSPCILFIDEIDSIGRQRTPNIGGVVGGNDERDSTLNQLLSEMDGFEGNTGVIVIAATNRVDMLDAALVRPGRFDRRIVVGLPDVQDRAEILKVHARGKPLADDLDLSIVAERTPGLSGADLANLMNEAAIVAARNDKTEVGNEEVNYVIDRQTDRIQKTLDPLAQLALEVVGDLSERWLLSREEQDELIEVITRERDQSITTLAASCRERNPRSAARQLKRALDLRSTAVPSWRKRLARRLGFR